MTPPNTSTLNSLRRGISAHWQNISARRECETLGGVSTFAYLCVGVSMLFFSYLLLIDPRLFAALTQEDSWVEYLTAALFMLTSVLLFFTAAAERSLWRRGVYVLGGIVMVFAAGEEISWGQRILGFATPDLLIGMNRQDEFNVHNIIILSGRFEKIYQYGTLLLCAITFAAFFFRKDRLFGFPLPSILLMLCFLLMLSYRPSVSFLGSLSFISFMVKGLLLLFIIYALLSRKARLFIPVAASLALIIAVSYINYRSMDLLGRNIDLLGGIHEALEYLLGVACLFYALELLLAQESARRRLAAVSIGISGGLRSAGGRLPLPRGIRRRSGSAPAAYSKPPALVLVGAFLRSPLLAVCSLVIVGSIGLIPLERSISSAKDAVIEERYQSIVSGDIGEPTARSTFDIYLAENLMSYTKQSCALADLEAHFFLHITPTDEGDLFDHRRPHGFDNLDFDFDDRGVMSDGKCIATVPLPEYDITNIKTGQYNRPDEKQIWKVEFPSSSSAKDAAIEERYQSIVSGDIGEPTVRSTFDIYLAENLLSYAKQPCAAADIEAQFFLHITPTDEGDLFDHRRPHGFDNLDFDFDDRGVMSDGKCIATVPLPEYDITNIKTGQYNRPDEKQIWKVEFPSSSNAKDAAIEERYQLIVSGDIGEPTVRSTFDIYLAENLLSYAKQPCAPADIEARFFLHIVPASRGDLPISRWLYGFNNLDFGFDDHGVMFDGKCIATIPLPEYDITNIRTGQYIPDEGQLWKVEFPFRE